MKQALTPRRQVAGHLHWEDLPQAVRDAAYNNAAAVAESAERLRRNLQLTTLPLDLPTIPMEKIQVQPEELFGYLEEMEMKGTLAEAKKRYREPELF